MPRHRTLLPAILAAAFALPVTVPVGADEDLPARDVAREDQNPLTRFYTLRFEDNAQLGFGPEDEVLNFFRVQPLVPIDLGTDWTLAARAIIPLAHHPWPESAFGLSDMGVQLFLTPSRTGSFVWGAGPSLLMPTATDDRIGTEKWSMGPAVAMAWFKGPWVAGVVAQNLWSFAGNDDRRDVNAMVFRPLVNYNLPNGWYLSTSPSIAANWQADPDNRWLVPVGGGIGRVFSIGNQRMSALVESYYHLVSPDVGPAWQLRIQVSFLYPE